MSRIHKPQARDGCLWDPGKIDVRPKRPKMVGTIPKNPFVCPTGLPLHSYSQGLEPSIIGKGLDS